MATNIEQLTTPAYWTSTSDDVIYTFGFKDELIQAVGDNGGFLQVQLQADFIVAPTVGQQVYIESPVYTGVFTITSVDGARIVTLNTAYITTITTFTYYLKHLRIPEFSLYKGFKTGEDFPADLPYTLVTTIKPVYVFDSDNIPYIKINVKGIVKYMFTISPNYMANEPDFSVFNAIRLEWDSTNTVFSTSHIFTLVLNCGLTNAELLERYINQGFFLVPTDNPVIMLSGVTFVTYFYYSTLTTNYPIVRKFVNGLIV